MRRRDVLRTAAAGMTAAAGCLGGFETESAWRDPPMVEDRPDAVYVPAVSEGMKMYGSASAGPYGVALSYSYPHRFWTMTGTERSKTVVESDDSLHLMASLWDRESGRVLPVDGGVEVEVTRDDALVSQEVAYPMLSQRMGFHYGSNFVLDGEGDYEATVRVGGVSLRRTGSFAGRFETVESVTLPFTFDTDALYDVSFEQLGDRGGTRGALEPMGMSFPLGRAPATADLPGRVLGVVESGDARLRVGVVDAGQAGRFGTDGDAYLYVAARTPHNGFVLPMMGLSARVVRDGEAVFEGDLARTLDPTLGYHYGAACDGVAAGDEVTVAVDVPPQVARHDGYETAFVSMPPGRVTA
jgi:hypothetical protein